MKILLLGSGGREHAIAWKLAQDDPSLDLVAAPGNPGIASLGRCVPVSQTDAATNAFRKVSPQVVQTAPAHEAKQAGTEVTFAWEDYRTTCTYDDEDALAGIAAHLGVALRRFLAAGGDVPPDEEPVTAPGGTGSSLPRGEPLRVRYYGADSSVFFGDDYLIKGVAGAVLWKLLGDHAAHGRTTFTNRELRLAPELRLPDVSDNLEARLLLLTRRLVERDACVRIEKTGRGRFRLQVGRPLVLVDASTGGR